MFYTKLFHGLSKEFETGLQGQNMESHNEGRKWLSRSNRLLVGSRNVYSIYKIFKY
jgi:hypothetical protein